MFYQKSSTRFLFFKRFILTYLILVSFLFVFLGGIFLGYQNGVSLSSEKKEGRVLNKEELPSYLSKDVDFKLFWDVWKIVKEKYLEQPVADTRLFYGSLSGIVASLGDPYSTFLDPEVTKKFTEELSGTFEGIGAEIGIKKDQLQIIAPLPNTPAERAGLKPKDKILAIDGKETIDMSIDYAVSLIRGPKGTQVTLTIFRDGWEKPKDITITRDEIHIQSVSWKMINNLAYFKVSAFNGETISRFASAAQEALLKNPKGIILDLRNNPGGYFDAAIALASYWLPKDSLVVIQKGQKDEKEEFFSQGPGLFKDFPTVVLVNGGSASAAEIVAGAIQDFGQGKIIGEKTFGKGSVQNFIPLNDGSSLKITVAEWLTPKGRSINKEGIIPDIEVKLTKEDFDSERDPQLERAIELLSKEKKEKKNKNEQK
jgi:carboxyl-terminal processing protease